MARTAELPGFLAPRDRLTLRRNGQVQALCHSTLQDPGPPAGAVRLRSRCVSRKRSKLNPA